MKRLLLIPASFIIATSAMAQSKCVTAPVSITGTPVTITSSGDKSITNDKVYIYYARKHAKKHEAYNLPVADQHPSMPLRMSNEKVVQAVPETYNVSLTTPQSNVAVCPDSALNVAANIDLEKVSSYTGNYPGSNGDKNEYKKVTRHQYKMAARKMRKVKRNEEKIARKTGMSVEARSDKA